MPFLSYFFLDFFALESTSFLRSHARLGSFLSIFGLARIESLLSALDFIHMESFQSIRSFARLDSLLLVFGIAHSGSFLSGFVLIELTFRGNCI